MSQVRWALFIRYVTVAKSCNSHINLDKNVFTIFIVDNLLIGWFGLYASNHNDKERETEEKRIKCYKKKKKKEQGTTSIFTKRKQSTDFQGIYRACALWKRISKIYSFITHMNGTSSPMRIWRYWDKTVPCLIDNPTKTHIRPETTLEMWGLEDKEAEH